MTSAAQALSASHGAARPGFEPGSNASAICASTDATAAGKNGRCGSSGCFSPALPGHARSVSLVTSVSNIAATALDGGGASRHCLSTSSRRLGLCSASALTNPSLALSLATESAVLAITTCSLRMSS